MHPRSPVCGALAVTALLVAIPLATVAQTRSIVFTDVTVIDATGTPAQPGMTVVIRDGLIARIGKTGSVSVPAGSLVVQGRGKYLIPGLWDMHVHLTEDDLAPLVANGVTGVRDMGNVLADVDAWRGRIAARALVGPRIFRVGPILNGEEFGPEQLAIHTEAEARTAVRVLKKVSVDAIKVHTMLPREAYFALADEARKLAIPFVGHVPQSVAPFEASNAGQASLEHIQTLFEGQFPPKPDSEPQLFALFAKNGTVFDPTLVTYRGSTQAQNVDPALLRDYPDLLPGRQKLFARFVELVGLMNRAGVTLLTGTDLSGFKWISPGASLHDELALFVDAGLTPMEALQTATRNPARFLHVEAGTIEVGKRADLVLLDANPLADIRNTRRISAVVLDGTLFDRTRLDTLGGPRR
jgi:imidazolonepropionase-like amidohydrolase